MGELSAHESKPKCYTSNGEPYPLCTGNGAKKCEQCCLNESYEKYHDPYEER